MDLPSGLPVVPRETFACPYCDGEINHGALSCRSCGRDLTPVLPLLRRLDELQSRLAAVEAREEGRLSAMPARAELAETMAADAGGDTTEAVTPVAPSITRRRFWSLPIGFAALMAAYWVIAIWLDLPLAVLRLASIVIPFVVGMTYLRRRLRATWLDATVAVAFSVVAVAAMNALLGWIDSTPMLPQEPAAWRESFFYALSIGASLFCGMLLRVTQAALSARGLTSLPRLRESVMAVNGKVPMDTLKAIELTILLASTAISAITGLIAGFLGVTR